MLQELRTISLNEANSTLCMYGGNPVSVSTARQGTEIDISSFLSHPEGFYGSTLVHQFVRFGGTFEGLIGQDGRLPGEWEIDELPKKGIVILEYYCDEAKRLVGRVNKHAQRFVDEPRFYDDLPACQEYFNMAKEGYDMLRSKEREFFDSSYKEEYAVIPVSFERAGLVSTRLALGKGPNEIIPGEVRVVTKRTHINGESDTHLSVSVKWRDAADAERIDGKVISVNDFVNPASGASTAAFLLAARGKDHIPGHVAHTAIMATRQGILFNQSAMRNLGCTSAFYSLGECDQLDSHYYLTGKPVGDAGQALRHFLPNWYTQ